jgi:hypothetical protein
MLCGSNRDIANLMLDNIYRGAQSARFRKVGMLRAILISLFIGALVGACFCARLGQQKVGPSNNQSGFESVKALKVLSAATV